MTNFLKIIACVSVLFGWMCHVALAQEPNTRKVTGTVKDTQSVPVADATVDGGNNVTKANVNGYFELIVPAEDVTVSVSAVGFAEKRIRVGRTTNSINVVLETADELIDEVVVVGYGQQRRSNLTGAVDQISGSTFQNRPITNLSQGLQGMVPNLNITPADGRPTQSPALNVRGVTSIGQGGEALVLIDGVEGNPALINPHDIESVTVLKDASAAAVYGARAAFGVILITTKNPIQDQARINYTANYAIKDPTYIPDFVTDSYVWASMFNEAFSSWNNYASFPQNVNKTMRFSQEYLEELKRRNEDPSLPRVEVDPVTGEYVYYDSHDWMASLYKPNTYSLDQNVNISGRSDKTSYMLSGRMLNQPGLFRYNSDDYKMYNFRAKGNVEIFPWLNVHNNTEYSKTSYWTPLNVGEGGGIWRNIVAEGHPMAPMFNPDGTLTHSAAYTVGDYLYGKNGMDYDRNVLRTTTGFASKFLDNRLSVKGDFTYLIQNNDEMRVRVPVPYSRIPGVVEYLGMAYNDIREIRRNNQYLTSNIYAEYEQKFRDQHYFKALLGYNYELNTYKRIGMERNGLIYEDAQDINLALGDAIAATGGYEQWNIMGGFFRLNYIFDDRYLVELNGRYDGSSKFPADQRFALFPSASVGWRLSNEPFWNVSQDYVSDIKLRASYGSLGNGSIGSYIFQERLSLGTTNRVLEGIRQPFTRNPAVIPDGLTWETSTTSNFGADLTFLRHKLSLTADYYIRKTTNMFTEGRELPAVFGAASPRGNYADMKTSGFELTVTYRDNFNLAEKPFNYSVRGVLSDNKSTILKYNNERKLLNDYYEGQILGEIWGYVTDGFFTSEHQIRTSADQSLFNTTASGVWRTGDIKFADLNNDGVINNGENTFYNSGDRVIIGNELPRYRFGLNLGADWNNFFISGFLQGVGKQNWYPSRGANTFWGQYNAPYGHPPVSQIGNIWSEDNPNAYFPRYTGYLAWTGGGTLREVQTRYLQNIAYVRLKNIQFGYHLKSELIRKVGAQSASVYFSGENLWTYSPLHKITKDIDVENTGDSDQSLADTNHGDGFNYPMLKSYSLGISLTF